MNRFAAVLAILAAGAFAPAQAAVVTFDDAGAPTGGYILNEAFSDQGLTFTIGGSSATAQGFLWDAASFGPAPGSNGTNTLLVGATGADFVTITRTGGGVFSISTLLLGISQPANTAETTDSVLVNGRTQAITTTAATYTVNQYNVTSVTVSGLQAGGYVSIDDINYQVPEPASLVVLGLGLAGLPLTRRRRGMPAPL